MVGIEATIETSHLRVVRRLYIDVSRRSVVVERTNKWCRSVDTVHGHWRPWLSSPCLRRSKDGTVTHLTKGVESVLFVVLSFLYRSIQSLTSNTSSIIMQAGRTFGPKTQIGLEFITRWVDPVDWMTRTIIKSSNVNLVEVS